MWRFSGKNGPKGAPSGPSDVDPTRRSSENSVNRKFNFAEFYEREVRRIPIPRTPVNKLTERDGWPAGTPRTVLIVSPSVGCAAFAVSVGLLLDALVGHGEVGLPGHAVVVGHLPGRLHDVRAAETCAGAL